MRGLRGQQTVDLIRGSYGQWSIRGVRLEFGGACKACKIERVRITPWTCNSGFPSARDTKLNIAFICEDKDCASCKLSTCSFAKLSA